MTNPAHVLWFKTTFGGSIAAAVAGTPFDTDIITAIACQETGYLWGRLRTRYNSVAQVTALCVGDTIDGKPDGSGRKAFPKTKADLLAWPQGAAMFTIARQDLISLAALFEDFRSAAQNPNKFCRGFGVFQYDLQFFKTDPNYFLQGKYRNFDDSLRKCIEELRRDLVKLGWQRKTSLTDYEMACVAIVYNSGKFDPRRGLLQGHYNSSESRYYGQAIADYLRMSRSVRVGAPAIDPTPGRAVLAASEPIDKAGKLYTVETRLSTLRLREDPKVSKPVTRNVIAELPEGQIVRRVAAKGKFLEIETNLDGARIQAFVHKDFLKPASADAAIAAMAPASSDPTSGVVAVYMPRNPGTVTKRTGIANAHSLNESGRPGRQGTSAAALRAELAAIVEWLGVDRVSHKRYQPRPGLTFCNIYAHDFCHLAGIYLPRVWWNSRAIAQLTEGRPVEPLYGRTIDEQRANDLFRWLRDFGLDFGWRRSVSLDELQAEVNQGAVGVIVARRREDGRSGHIVMVVPETQEHRARRDTAGKVVAPLQSQAGATNFRYGRGVRDWWKGAQFAESAFWLHA